MRPIVTKYGSTSTSIVEGSSSAMALSKARSSSVPAAASASVKWLKPSVKLTAPRQTSRLVSAARPSTGSTSRGTYLPFALRTSTSTEALAAKLSRGLGLSHAEKPARRTCSAMSAACFCL